MNIPEEMVDIVDETDNVLYSVSKREAHKKGFLHRTVISEVKDSNGRWMLVRQASDRQDAGQFVSPIGGHVMAGESEDDALKREAEEELGFKDIKLKLVGKVVFNRNVRNRQENHYFILYEVDSDEKPQLNHESVEYKYFTDEELKTALKETPEEFGDAFKFLVKTFYPYLLV